MKEIIVDTNVIVRLFVKDSEGQLKKAQEFIEEIEGERSQGLISVLILNEVIWVLGTHYKIDKKEYLPGLIKLLALKNIKIIEVEKILIMRVLNYMKNTKIDFTDVYLFNISRGRKIFSFDKDFEKLNNFSN